MDTLLVTVLGLLWLYLGYRYYGSFIEKRLIEPDESSPTAAVRLQDGVDFEPAKTVFLWGHHFASIAGAGPIIGPILGVSLFGWGPTTLWITLGSVFLGAVHDYLSLMLSVRSEGRGIAEIAGATIGKRTRIVFAILLWLTLVFIITVFAVSGAKALISVPQLVIPTFGVCLVAMALGFAVYRSNTNVTLASIVAVIVAYALIWVGYHYPISFGAVTSEEKKLEMIYMLTALFAYCAVASLLPVWLLLQPRDFISTVKMFVGLVLGLLGIIIVHPSMSAPFSLDIADAASQGKPVWPVLFIIVACGAISGFHTMVATGTTSKQLRNEKDGKVVGFGSMLMEAVLALVVVVVVSSGLTWGSAPEGSSPQQQLSYFTNALSDSWITAFGQGFGRIVGAIGIPGLSAAIAGLLGSVMVKTFIMTSLDTSTRLGRFIFVETFAEKHPFLNNKIVSTLIVLVPAYVLAVTNSYGNIWKMFGASNQLIAAAALITISAYLANAKRPTRYTVIPAVFMLFTTVSALLWGAFNFVDGYFMTSPANTPLGVISLFLAALGAMVSIDGLRAIRSNRTISSQLGNM